MLDANGWLSECQLKRVGEKQLEGRDYLEEHRAEAEQPEYCDHSYTHTVSHCTSLQRVGLRATGTYVLDEQCGCGKETTTHHHDHAT